MLCLISWSCSKKKSNTDPDPQPQNFDPDRPILSLPTQNAICTTGDDQTATQSTVAFDWNDANHASGYTITVKNLLTNEIKTQEAATSDTKMALARSTPFSWTVIAKSSTSTITAPSETWKFYNSGPGVTSYAPFPATAVNPAMGQFVTVNGTTLTLNWDGSDADGDLSGFDIYFGINSTPPNIKSVAADVKKLDISVSANTIYYWKVISKDAKGNQTDSGIFQFKVN